MASSLLAQQKEFDFEHTRETEAKKWLPDLTGEMDAVAETASEEDEEDEEVRQHPRLTALDKQIAKREQIIKGVDRWITKYIEKKRIEHVVHSRLLAQRAQILHEINSGA